MKKFPLNKKIVFAFFLAVAISPAANAQLSQENIIEQQDRIIRDQQNKIDEDKRAKEQELIKKERARKKKEQKEEEKKDQPQTTISKKAPPCIPLKEIRLSNATLISKKNQKKLTTIFLGKCADPKALSNLVSNINSYYNQQGYSTAQVSIPKQNIQSGVLELKVLEGKIGGIILGNNNFSDRMQGFTAFGASKGAALNLNDINQGLYQINRLPSNNATMKIEPGEEEGEAKIYILNDKKFPARANIAYDNLGNDFTGIYRTTFSGAADNLLSLNDNINLSYTTNLNDDSKTKDIKSFTSGISIPLGYNTFSYDYSRSTFRGTNDSVNGPVAVTGYSDRNSLAIDRVLLSKGNLRIAGNAALTTKGSASYFNRRKLAVSERDLTISTLSFSISDYFKNGINLYMKPSFSKGLKILNAKKDNSKDTADVPKAQFQLFKFYASISKKFIVPKIVAPINFGIEMDSQISEDTLFGSEQFSVGGYSSVRGFRENFITGDSGYYFRNKANFNLGSWVLPLIKKENSANWTYLNKFAIEPFYDYGAIQNHYTKDSGRLSGTGVKAIFENKYFHASLTYSWALQKSQLITTNRKENKMIYFEVSAGRF